MATRMQQRRGTASQWTSANPVLNAGEMGWESDTNKFKIGDGTNHWADLDYFSDINSTVNPAFGSSITFEGATANDFETTLAITDPTADRTITFPDATGTVALTSDITVTAESTTTFTNKTLTSPKINEDVVVTATATELNYVDGVTSAIQTQLDAKAPSSTTVTLTGTQTLSNKTFSDNITLSSSGDFSITSSADHIILTPGSGKNVKVGSNVVATIDGTETFTNKTLTSPKINEDVAVTATATELNYVDGVTSAIQTQLDAKASSSTAVTLTGTQTLSNKTLNLPNVTVAATVLYSVGDTGPGGGTIFYDAGSEQSWGRYLEVAPNTWDGGDVGDGNYRWSANTNTLVGTTSAIGDGLSNTQAMVALDSALSSGDGGTLYAGTNAYAYSPNGRTFHLPSQDELNALYAWAFDTDTDTALNGDFTESEAYASSTETSSTQIVARALNGTFSSLVFAKTNTPKVRPISYVSSNGSSTISSVEIGYLDAVSSNIQAQLDAKAPLTSPTLVTPNIGVATGTSLVLSGDLTINGTPTNINSTNLVVEDKNIVLGDVETPTDTTADGGGITLKGATDKTINWVDATDAWTSSEDFNLVTGKSYEIAGTSVLSGSTLGSGITASSLTSVGTITSGTWNGTTIAVANGGTGITSFGSGIADFLGTPSSANLISAVTDETGTGSLVFGTAPTITNALAINPILRGPEERWAVSATAATGTIPLDTLTSGILYYTSDASANWTLNVRGSSEATLNDSLTTNDSITVVFFVTNGATPYYQTGFQVDGNSITPKWQNATAPAAGNANSIDIYSFTIVKTGDAAFTAFGSQTRFA
jgi:hypothetical protein